MINDETLMYLIDESYRKFKEAHRDMNPPKYKYEDYVEFDCGEELGVLKGKVYIVDRYGTFEQNEEPSYDIMVEKFKDTGDRCLVKHIRESWIIGYAEGENE